MTVRVSSGFKQAILGPAAFETIFNGGRILLFSGAQPASPDLAATGVLLGEITADGLPWIANGVQGGLRFARSGMWVLKDPAQAWRLRMIATGTAGYFRLVGKGLDSLDDSTIATRIDGAIGAGGAADLVLADTHLVAGSSTPVQSFLYSISPLGA